MHSMHPTCDVQHKASIVYAIEVIQRLVGTQLEPGVARCRYKNRSAGYEMLRTMVGLENTTAVRPYKA